MSSHELLVCVIWYLVVYNNSRSGAEWRNMEWMRDLIYDEGNGVITLISGPSKNSSEGHQKRELEMREVSHPILYDVLNTYRVRRPHYEDMRTKAFFLKALKTGYSVKIVIGCNMFTTLVQDAAKICNIKFIGSIYGLRYTVVTHLFDSGVNLKVKFLFLF